VRVKFKYFNPYIVQNECITIEYKTDSWEITVLRILSTTSFRLWVKFHGLIITALPTHSQAHRASSGSDRLQHTS